MNFDEDGLVIFEKMSRAPSAFKVNSLRFKDNFYPKNEDKELYMGKPRFTEEFKIDAIKQITECGRSVADFSHRLIVSTHSIYTWVKHPLSTHALRTSDRLSF
eukprot:GHVR01158067.1.p1 GENE.GHVR01158067.1~~GHVR01158067.1.p1  ORF type:complete len:103 (-),score=4.18 GHVR01158067.1:4-312(-)